MIITNKTCIIFCLLITGTIEAREKVGAIVFNLDLEFDVNTGGGASQQGGGTVTGEISTNNEEKRIKLNIDYTIGVRLDMNGVPGLYHSNYSCVHIFILLVIGCCQAINFDESDAFIYLNNYFYV